jgi:hypothetical protein
MRVSPSTEPSPEACAGKTLWRHGVLDRQHHRASRFTCGGRGVVGGLGAGGRFDVHDGGGE